ncbi:ferric reductase [Amycolatopsis sp. K13G38]|uniref:Ferric reductase n=1 Tax=Amycolatopsis acididurans TaxID=2724524 RepID=A0ABX1J866_9PSEU|nr:ferric reductase-like transmembrane domain-containing protein [Amycolatopsis acididurans]NKQ55982.1 ferric reductase [Amycolatopsis acididurans]
MTALWYLSRATGLALLIMLTSVVVLGALHSGRFAARKWPRFAIAEVHRNLSLVTVVFLVVHVATAIIDPYAGIHWLDAVLPFVSSYHPFWLGLGAFASDLFLALIISSLLRPRISARAWRALHWTAYACWPFGLVHGLGIGGADSRLAWVLLLMLCCGVAVLIAVVWRYNARHPDTEARRRPWTGMR